MYLPLCGRIQTTNLNLLQMICVHLLLPFAIKNSELESIKNYNADYWLQFQDNLKCCSNMCCLTLNINFKNIEIFKFLWRKIEITLEYSEGLFLKMESSNQIIIQHWNVELVMVGCYHVTISPQNKHTLNHINDAHHHHIKVPMDQ